MWSIQILWNDVWVTVQRGFASKDKAEWATAVWKMKNGCVGDPFRAFSEDEQNRKDAEKRMRVAFGAEPHDQRAEDEAVYQNELRNQLSHRV